MSKIANKHMFAFGMGMQFITAFCATGTEKLHVINGKGGPLSDIRSISKPE